MIDRDIRVGILVGARFHPNIKRILLNLGRMMPSNVNLDLLTTKPEVPKVLKDNYSIYCRVPTVSVDAYELRSNLGLCREFIRERTPDILMNVNQPQTLGVVVSWVCRGKDVTSIIRMTGDSYQFNVESVGITSRLSRLLRLTLPAHLAFRLGDRVVPVGEYLVGELRNHDIPENRITVLPQPFDARPFQRDNDDKSRELRNAFGLESADRVVLYVGRLSLLKGSDRLKTIVSNVIERSDNIQFLFVGTGPWRNKLLECDSNRVTIVDSVPPQQMPAIYQLADRFIFCSRTEGLPNVILEALASGLPIISTPVGEVPGLISHTSQSEEDFVEWVLTGNVSSDSLPDSFRWELLKERYTKLFIETAGK